MEQRPTIIAGRWVTRPNYSEIRSPFDQALVGAVPHCTVTDVAAAVGAAVGAFRTDRMAAWRRAEILDRAAARLTEPEVGETFVSLMVGEAAKPASLARAEVERAASTFRFAAAVCRSMTGDVLPLDAEVAGEGRLGFTRRVPIGVVGAISPFNFPLNLVAHKVAPAIAAGCPVVLKPAHQTPLTALELARMLIEDCGLPPTWMSVVPGSGETVGRALVDDPRVAMVTFTGSPEVGWGIRAAAPRKRVSLELGNNSPVIVEPDAPIGDVAARIAVAAFGFAGQSCISVQRILANASIAEELLDALATEAGNLAIGDPTDDLVRSSAVIDRVSHDRVISWVEEARRDGAMVVAGGSAEGPVIAPTVIWHTETKTRLWRDEVFGPAATVMPYSSVGEAIALANDSRYGLHASIFTNDLDSARRAIDELDYGGVIVNDVPTWRADQMPYGGGRDSGNTREGPRYSVLEMTELKTAIFA